jgi:hypothetical protein
MDTKIADESYDLKTLAGGQDTVGQIQVCGSPTTNQTTEKSGRHHELEYTLGCDQCEGKNG